MVALVAVDGACVSVVQVVPLVEYSILKSVIAEPPVSVGAVHVIFTEFVVGNPVDTVNAVGAAGANANVVAVTTVLAVPVPLPLTPETRNLYAVARVNPVTESVVEFDAV